jgi:hypothetical protein
MPAMPPQKNKASERPAIFPLDFLSGEVGHVGKVLAAGQMPHAPQWQE